MDDGIFAKGSQPYLAVRDERAARLERWKVGRLRIPGRSWREKNERVNSRVVPLVAAGSRTEALGGRGAGRLV